MDSYQTSLKSLLLLELTESLEDSRLTSSQKDEVLYKIGKMRLAKLARTVELVTTVGWTRALSNGL